METEKDLLKVTKKVREWSTSRSVVRVTRKKRSRTTTRRQRKLELEVAQKCRSAEVRKESESAYQESNGCDRKATEEDRNAELEK